MLRHLSAVALVLGVTISVASGEEAGDVTQFTLENRLEVVVIEDHRSPAVTQMLWYKVGAADEVAGSSGVAHLLEHLMFKGTEKRASGEFSQIVEANGGSDNAFTSWDYTAYYQRIAVDRLPLIMEMEADRMSNLRLSDEEVAPEVNVVLEERAQRTDTNPRALYSEQGRAAQYLNHPYGRPIIGWRHEVSQLDGDDALEFYRAHYVPNNAVLVVAGDVTPGAVRDLAETYYGPIPANPDLPDRARVVEPPQLAARRLVFEDPRIAQPYVIRSYLAPERDTGAQDKAAALTLLADLLGDTPVTSYLGRKLQYDSDVALFTGAGYSATSLDETTFNLTVVPSEGTSLDEVEAAMDQALAQFMVDGVDETRLARLKKQYEASAIYALDSAEGRAQMYGAALTSGLTVADVQAWPEVIQNVSAEQIMTAAEEVLNDKNSVTGWLRAPQSPDAAAEVGQ